MKKSVIRRLIDRGDREIKIALGKRRATKLDISFAPPNYLYRAGIAASGCVIDVGCADNPEIAIHLMRKFGVKAFAVDPTRRHFNALRQWEVQFEGRLQHIPAALAYKSGEMRFYESKENLSGSLLETHSNVRSDRTVSYVVEALTITELLKRLGITAVDYLKIDLEGAEYDLISNAAPELFASARQIFVEFHHHCIESRTFQDTEHAVGLLCDLGFKTITLDRHNYLFWRP
jgi:FkbM family methyltransferase